MRRIPLVLVVLALLAGCAGTQLEPTPSASPEATTVTVPTTGATQAPPATAPALPSAESPLPTATSPDPDSPLPTATPDEAAVDFAIVTVRDGDLWLKPLPDGEEVRLTGLGDVVQFPEFSADGRLVLFHREGPAVTISTDPAGDVPTTTLWAVPVTGGEPYMVLDPLAALPSVPGTGGRGDDVYPSEPGSLAWLPSGEQVLFSSRYLTINGTISNDDLWRLDVDSGKLEALLPAGQGGRPTVSPDGAWVLLNTGSEIHIARVDGSERRNLLTFERVPTYSEWEWVPEPEWDDHGSVHVAVAQPWTVGEPVTYELWRLEPESDQQEMLGEVQASWLHTPLWSPDRLRLAYAAAGGGLALADEGGREPRLVAAGDDVVPLAWSPAGRRLAFVQAGQYCAVEDVSGAEPVCLASTFYSDARWLDEGSLVMVASIGEDQPGLVSAELPAGTTTELWSAPVLPLFYDLRLGR
jgi:dipeptidyl aminopeptidase/acylaminoacyl peptidase